MGFSITSYLLVFPLRNYKRDKLRITVAGKEGKKEVLEGFIYESFDFCHDLPFFPIFLKELLRKAGFENWKL